MHDHLSFVDTLTDAQCRYALLLLVDSAHMHGEVSAEVADAILIRASNHSPSPQGWNVQ